MVPASARRSGNSPDASGKAAASRLARLVAPLGMVVLKEEFDLRLLGNAVLDGVYDTVVIYAGVFRRRTDEGIRQSSAGGLVGAAKFDRQQRCRCLLDQLVVPEIGGVGLA